MFNKISTFLALAFTMSSALAAIDFTPVIDEFTSQGFTFRKVTFKTDEGAVIYIPPTGWEIRGAQNQAQLTPPRSMFGRASIKAKPLAGPHPFDEATMQALEQQVLEQAPPTSQGVGLVHREQNPVLMNEYLSFEVVIIYQTLGDTFQRSVLFIRTPDTDIVFELSAPKAEFRALHDAFRRSVLSWRIDQINQNGTGSA